VLAVRPQSHPIFFVFISFPRADAIKRGRSSWSSWKNEVGDLAKFGGSPDGLRRTSPDDRTAFVRGAQVYEVLFVELAAEKGGKSCENKTSSRNKPYI